jgi:hypothetical protein
MLHSTTPLDPRAYRNTIGLFATGVTIVSTQLGETVHGMTANAVTSLSLEKARPFPDAARETVLSLHDVAFHAMERPTSVKPDFLPDLTVAPPNDQVQVIGGAVERIFQPPRCQIHHHPPRCGEVVLREKRPPNRKKEKSSQEKLTSVEPVSQARQEPCSLPHAHT